MEEYYTSVDQSKALFELGLDANTADMCYTPLSYNDSTILCNVPKTHRPYEGDFPCWSVTALLSVIGKFTLQTISKYRLLLVSEEYDHCIDGVTILDVCYRMTEWLLKNKLIKK